MFVCLPNRPAVASPEPVSRLLVSSLAVDESLDELLNGCSKDGGAKGPRVSALVPRWTEWKDVSRG